MQGAFRRDERGAPWPRDHLREGHAGRWRGFVESNDDSVIRFRSIAAITASLVS